MKLVIKVKFNCKSFKIALSKSHEKYLPCLNSSSFNVCFSGCLVALRAGVWRGIQKFKKTSDKPRDGTLLVRNEPSFNRVRSLF